ncbi:MAG: GNAT family N-acetyltransferase, partial [Pyrinomonadaceae bacterium]|nr:GNAT family N-acetyltransferase [Pyrinomonadaceae bacterium]
MRIIDATKNEHLNRQMADILFDGFSDTGTEAWSTMEECTETLNDSLKKTKISRIALDDSDEVLAWTIGEEVYTGHTWELELLVVRRESKLKGLGRKMLEDFEEE